MPRHEPESRCRSGYRVCNGWFDIEHSSKLEVGDWRRQFLQDGGGYRLAMRLDDMGRYVSRMQVPEYSGRRQ